MGKNIHVVSMDVEVTAVIRKDIIMLARKGKGRIIVIHSFVLLFFAIFLNDSYGFHIHGRHMYVLPRGCAHDENT